MSSPKKIYETGNIPVLFAVLSALVKEGSTKAIKIKNKSRYPMQMQEFLIFIVTTAPT